jgi:hypothetical protein
MYVYFCVLRFWFYVIFFEKLLVAQISGNAGVNLWHEIYYFESLFVSHVLVDFQSYLNLLCMQ